MGRFGLFSSFLILLAICASGALDLGQEEFVFVHSFAVLSQLLCRIRFIADIKPNMIYLLPNCLHPHIQ